MKEKISGVYKITNTITGDFYIGSSCDIKRRWAQHKVSSTWKSRPGMKLYQDMAKYGRDNFLFEIIEETDNLTEREQYFIDILKPSYNNIRANGIDIERRKETMEHCKRRWYKANREERLIKGIEYNKTHQEEIQAYQKEYRELHREERSAYHKEYYETHKKVKRVYNKEYYGRLCFYNNETLTLGALSRKFQKLSIPHPTLEAKKYLITEEEIKLTN